jgi:hypothetical protein
MQKKDFGDELEALLAQYNTFPQLLEELGMAPNQVHPHARAIHQDGTRHAARSPPSSPTSAEVALRP